MAIFCFGQPLGVSTGLTHSGEGDTSSSRAFFNAMGQESWPHRRFHLPVPQPLGRRTHYTMPLFIRCPRLNNPLGCHIKFKVGALHGEYGGRGVAAQVGGTFYMGLQPLRIFRGRTWALWSVHILHATAVGRRAGLSLTVRLRRPPKV
jgi:hypothetical protein